MNRRVLLAWEAGAGHGHARRLAILGEALHARHWRVSHCGRYLEAEFERLGRFAEHVFQAPIVRGRALPGDRLPADYGELLEVMGFGAAQSLAPLIRADRAILEACRPDIVIADFAPAMVLAARGIAPVLVVGDGFVVPPAHLAAFPPLRPGAAPGAGHRDLRTALGAVLGPGARIGALALPALIGGDAQVVTVLPEFDVYASYRTESAAGRLGPLPPPCARWEEDAGVIFYLAGDYLPTAGLLQAIGESGASARGYIRGATGEHAKIARQYGIELSAEPLPLAECLSGGPLVAHHGGIETVQEAAAAGCAQCLFPRHLEQAANAAAVRAHGLGIAIPSGGFERGDAAARIRALLADRAVRDAAIGFARRLRRRDGLRQVLAAVQSLQESAAAGPAAPGSGAGV